MTPSQAAAKAAEIVGTTYELARQLGVKPPTVHQWVTGDRPVPPKRAVKIEELTGGEVTRQQLCPDFPWNSAA